MRKASPELVTGSLELDTELVRSRDRTDGTDGWNSLCKDMRKEGVFWLLRVDVGAADYILVYISTP